MAPSMPARSLVSGQPSHRPSAAVPTTAAIAPATTPAPSPVSADDRVWAAAVIPAAGPGSGPAAKSTVVVPSRTDPLTVTRPKSMRPATARPMPAASPSRLAELVPAPASRVETLRSIDCSAASRRSARRNRVMSSWVAM